jgi:hypothetical protein
MGDHRFKKLKASGSARIAAPPEPGSSQHLTPVFCLRYLAKGYGLPDCEDAEAAMFTAKLVSLCQLDWNEIAKSARDGMGHEKMPKDQILAPLPNRVTEDVAYLLVFRFGGPNAARIIGLRKDRVFEVYLIDPKGHAYKH